MRLDFSEMIVVTKNFPHHAIVAILEILVPCRRDNAILMEPQSLKEEIV